MNQDIRSCTARDGTRIAYATSGRGLPIVKAANWMNHLEYDWESPVWRHTFRALSQQFRLIRYDERGTGLSDRDVADVSFDAWVSDLEAVVDAIDLRLRAALDFAGRRCFCWIRDPASYLRQPPDPAAGVLARIAVSLARGI